MAETTESRRWLQMMADLAGYSSSIGSHGRQRLTNLLSLPRSFAAEAG